MYFDPSVPLSEYYCHLLLESSYDEKFIFFLMASAIFMAGIASAMSTKKITVTKREKISSIAIIAIMMTFGIIAYGWFNDNLILRYQDYNLALQVENDKDLFEYAMSTDIGEAFVYGSFECVDPVTFDELGGGYSYVKKVKQIKHDGEWEIEDVLENQCNSIMFLGKEFEYETMNFHYATSKITTIESSEKVRYIYYGIPAQGSGTLHADLRNDTIENATFYVGDTIYDRIEVLESNWQSILFWMWWFATTAFVVYCFVYIDNRWLEEKRATGKR